MKPKKRFSAKPKIDLANSFGIAMVALIGILAVTMAFGYLKEPKSISNGELSAINNFDECVAAGYTLLESFPQRECRTPDGRIFVEGTMPAPPPIEDPYLNQETCEVWGGNWNECGSRCLLETQGREDIECALACEALCECGGIAGFTCPDGYTCVRPEEIQEALGYCVRSNLALPEETPITESVAETPVSQVQTPEEAIEAAKNTICSMNGILTGEVTYDEFTHSWWIDLEPYEPFEGCNPACVIDEFTLNAEVNWRCLEAAPAEEVGENEI
ncbi:MAG: hypothetical protein JW727_05780 [Candidatus Aenigmarchaeota archaeon]|nr:hypothetical protein [Candidatus Aenigmarchaeota archaeon]